MTYNILAVTARLLTDETTPWHVAPEAVQAAARAAHEATSASAEADAAIPAAAAALAQAETDWQAAGLQATRDGKALPKRDTLDTARFRGTIAREDADTATGNAAAAVSTLAGLLNNPTVRDEYADLMTARLDTIKAALLAQGETLNPLIAELSAIISNTYMVGQWTSHIYPPNMVEADVTAALNRTINTKPYTAAGFITA